MFLKTWRVHKIFLNRTKKMVSVFERGGYHPVQAFWLKVVCPNRCVLRIFFLFWLRKRQWQKVEKFLDLARRLKTCRAHGRVRYIPTKGNYKIYLFLGPSIFFLNRSNRQLQNSCDSQQAACTNGCEAMREIILLPFAQRVVIHPCVIFEAKPSSYL